MDNKINNIDIKYIKGVGEKRLTLLNKLGIHNFIDLIEYFPRNYEDRTQIIDIANLISGENQLIKASLISPVNTRYIRRNLNIQNAIVKDETGECELTWFNQTYLPKTLYMGKTYFFYGKCDVKYGRRSMSSPKFEIYKEEKEGGGILPIYSLTKNLTQYHLRTIIKNALEMCKISENLPEYLLKENNLLCRDKAIRTIHFPNTFNNLYNAKSRLVFEELFFMQLALLYMKNVNNISYGSKCIKDDSVNNIIKNLPFSLTNAQMKSIKEIEKDMESDISMNRLLQGDVGSGKTIISIIASYKAVKSGFQAAIMVPTSILAMQHLESFKLELEKYNINIQILKSKMKKSEKTKILEDLENGKIDIIIGTHALIEENVKFKNLGLVVTDEQHRFGVNQREKIISKGNNPNMLVMSATPIPRTLALILYGDLDISIIDELPKNRLPIKTTYALYKQEEVINKFIMQELNKGRQAFVVCPLVEEQEEDTGLRSVEEVYKSYKKSFYNKNVSYIHGKMKEDEKDKIMEDFLNKKIDILIATTVIEVGIDVPNSNIMVIENAERFGLSQLHQLRGRVGRGKYQSYCILKVKSGNNLTKERIKIMCETTDGFVISEKDLELRGSGDFFGTKQHGIPDFKIANLFEDVSVLKRVQKISKNILNEDPNLEKEKNIKLKTKVEEMISTVL